jgi:spermidine synthase
VPELQESDGELRLVVEGAVQSVAVRDGETPRGYWQALIPSQTASTALILGIGGGTAAHLLRRKSPSTRITGVDNDPRVLDLARSAFGLDSTGVQLVLADARDFVAACGTRYDLVIVDLFRGEALDPIASSWAFQRGLHSIVMPGGTLVWNLHRDRRSAMARRRAGSGLLLLKRVFAGLNLVLHFHRRRYPRMGQ